MIKCALLLVAGCTVSVPPPQPINATINPGGTTACSTDADCVVGKMCRPIQGGNICMGDGGRGDYCMFDGDCLSHVCDEQQGGARYCR